MYGIQTYNTKAYSVAPFENDVKMYGIQTAFRLHIRLPPFENDVKMYGIQTINQIIKYTRCLRTM